MNEQYEHEAVVEEGISLAELLKIVWKNRILIALVTIWVMVLGIIYTFVVVEPKYTAETAVTVQVDPSAAEVSEQSAISIANALMATYREFIVTKLILNSVIDDIPEIVGMSAAQLENMIQISSQTGVYIIYIEAEHEAPEIAMAIANQIVENSIEIANDPQNGFLFLQNKLKMIYPADLPVNPSSPNKILNVVISLLIGAILSLGIVFVKEMLNNKFQSSDDVEKYLKIRVIASVPGVIKERKLVD
jgi:capsular polysaccharide biosynthesis protein